MLSAEQIDNWIDTATDGKTVWVNRGHTCVGRFSRVAFEVSTEEQCVTRKGPTTLSDWGYFKRTVQTLFDLEISDDLMPRHLREVA